MITEISSLAKITFHRCAISITLALSSGNTAIFYNDEKPIEIQPLRTETKEKNVILVIKCDHN